MVHKYLVDLNATTLYQGLLSLLDRGQWQDQRHLKTAMSMIVALHSLNKDPEN